MTMKRILILVEGQTEKRFVTDLLEPHLAGFGLFPVPKIVVTGRTNDGTQFQGGSQSPIFIPYMEQSPEESDYLDSISQGFGETYW